MKPPIMQSNPYTPRNLILFQTIYSLISNHQYNINQHKSLFILINQGLYINPMIPFSSHISLGNNSLTFDGQESPISYRFYQSLSLVSSGRLHFPWRHGIGEGRVNPNLCRQYCRVWKLNIFQELMIIYLFSHGV